MSLTKHLKHSPNDATSFRAYERNQTLGVARVEGLLYKAGIPDEHFNRLTQQLKGVSGNTLRYTLLLYERLRQKGLSEETSVIFLPQLATQELAALVRKGEEDKIQQYIDGIVQGYRGQIESAVARHSKIKDRHQGTGMMVYGSTNAEVQYGRRIDDKAVNNPRQVRIPPVPHIRKAERLAKAINAQNWRYAIELHRDLIGFSGHLFGTEADYRRFLTDVESIILQESVQHKVAILTHPQLGYPVGYEVMTSDKYYAHLRKNGHSSSTHAIQAARRAGRSLNGRPVQRSTGFHLSTPRDAATLERLLAEE